MKTILAIMGCIVALSACEVREGSPVKEKYKHRQMACTDFRDGEKFTFTIGKISSVSYGIGDNCYDVVDDGGKSRHLCNSMEAYMKCELGPA